MTDLRQKIRHQLGLPADEIETFITKDEQTAQNMRVKADIWMQKLDEGVCPLEITLCVLAEQLELSGTSPEMITNERVARWKKENAYVTAIHNLEKVRDTTIVSKHVRQDYWRQFTDAMKHGSLSLDEVGLTDRQYNALKRLMFGVSATLLSASEVTEKVLT